MSAPVSSNNESRFCDQASYSDLFFRLLDTVLLLDSETYQILDMNDAGEKLLNSPLEKVQQSSLLDWISKANPEGPVEFEKNLRIAKRRYYPRAWQAELSAPDRTIPISVSACMLKLSTDREVIQVILRDISKETEAQQKITEYINELELLNRKLEALSTTDEMTKLANYRHFRSQLQLEHARAHRYAGVYAIIFFDVDNFKHYNDRNGHPAGDELLRELGGLIKNSCRDTDLPARYGGEEFVILCPAVEWENAMVLAERVRKAVETRNFPFGEHQPLGKLSVSVGVASYPHDGATAEEIMNSADKSLYHSKESGRNRTTAHHSMMAMATATKKPPAEEAA